MTPTGTTGLFTVRPVDDHHTLADIRNSLADNPALSLLESDIAMPWLVASARDLTAAQLATHFAAPVHVEQVACHTTTDQNSITSAVTTAVVTGRIIVGREAVERGLQRRKLATVVIASGTSDDFTSTIQTIVNKHPSHVDVMITALTREQLGNLVGCRRAGCVGIARNDTAITVNKQVSRYRGRVVSSLPG